MSSIALYMGPIARQLLDAWSGLPRRDLVPDRQSFDPMAVVRILPVVSLLERKGGDEWRFRLVGTELDRRWGRALTGLDCMAIAAPEAAALMRREFAAVVEQPCASWSIRCVEYESGRRIGIEGLRLPLRGRDGRLGLILGCSGEAGTRRLGPDDRPRRVLKIVRQRFIDIGNGVPEKPLANGAQLGG